MDADGRDGLGMRLVGPHPLPLSSFAGEPALSLSKRGDQKGITPLRWLVLTPGPLQLRWRACAEPVEAGRPERDYPVRNR